MSGDKIEKSGHSAVEVMPRRASVQLTEKQTDRVIEGGLQVAGDIASIAKELVLIAKVREQWRGDVNKIDAETRQIEARVQVQISKYAAQRATVETKGMVVVAIIKQVGCELDKVPELDSKSRIALIEILPQLVRAAVKD